MSHTYNFLEQLEPEAVRIAHRKKRALHMTLAVFFVVAVLWFIAVVIASGQVFASVLDASHTLQEAKEQVFDLRFDQAETSLAQASEELRRAEIGMRILSSLKPMPWLGAQVTSLERLIDSGRQLIDVFIPLTDLGAELVRLSGAEKSLIENELVTSSTQTFGDLSSETKKAILQRMSASASDLYLVNAHLALVRADVDQLLSSGVFSFAEERFSSVFTKLDELQASLVTLEHVTTLLPELAGLDEEKVFLLLFLNNTELRPGGGFIGAYGIAKILNGDITSLQTADSYTLDDYALGALSTPAPDPLVTYNEATVWYMRDANWSPDFAVSALQVIERYVTEAKLVPESAKGSVPSPLSLHGVIGFTPSLASELLDLLGPITISGQEFTADNVADAIEYQVEVAYQYEGIPESQRKEILADLVDEMKERLFDLPLSQWASVLQIVEEGFRTKQLALYSADQETESVLIEVDWAGRITPQTTDVQMVVDANLASLKTDPSVERTISYEIFQNSGGDYVGRTHILYDHKGSFDWKTTRYRTYTRLYTPKGTTFIQASGTLANDLSKNPSASTGGVDIGEELEMTVFGAFTSVEPGEQQELVFEYYLADEIAEAVENGEYSLTVYKQMGASKYELELDLDFGENVQYAIPGEDRSEWGDSRYLLNTYLDQDLSFEVLF